MKKWGLLIVLGAMLSIILVATGCDSTGDTAVPTPDDPEKQEEQQIEFERQNLELKSDIVPSPVQYAVLLPPCYEEGTDYPLLLALHGGQGTRDIIMVYRNGLHAAIEEELVPPLVVATPTVTPRTFYMDLRDGSEKWETFIVEEFLPHLQKTLKVSSTAEKTMVTGISMGGMGALRLAFKYPDVFGVTAAFCPGIEPVFEFVDMLDRHRFWRGDDLFKLLFGDPVDHEYWTENNPATIARDNAEKLRDSNLHIFIEAGDEDVFLLHEGTAFLHRVLFDEGIRHEYHYYKWVDHSSDLDMRLRTLYQFLGRALDPPEAASRMDLILDLREAVGIPPERWVPPVFTK